MIGAGVPAGADSPNQESDSNGKPCSRKVGTSGKDGWRSAEHMPTAITDPCLICDAAEGRLSDIIGTWPAITACMAGPAPRKGTWVISVPIWRLICTTKRWLDDPAPEVATCKPPALFARAATSAMVRMPARGLATHTVGLLTTSAIWAKSFTGS